MRVLPSIMHEMNMAPRPARKPVIATFLILISTQVLWAQATIRLWDGPAPGALGTAQKDVPTLTVYLPDSAKATGAGIVICPGGGYAHVATAKEGDEYAKFLVMHGVAGFVLRYRLGSDGYRYPAIFQDVQRALRLVRFQSTAWHVDPLRIGVMGSSAGGHLAATLLTHFDAGNPSSPDSVERVSCRPDFGVLCYPVISMGPITHEGSKENLLGKRPSADLVALLSNEKQVTSSTPPCFLWHTSDDKTVSVQNSIAFADALAKNGVPFELHIYEHGPHGLGLGDSFPYAHALPWTRELVRWLRNRGLADTNLN